MSLIYKKSGYEFRNFNLAINQGDIIGIVGESGSGKSTIGKVLVGLINQTESANFGIGSLNGSLKCGLLNNNINYLEARYRELRSYRKHVQMIFQNHRASLNLNVTVYQTLAEAVKLGSRPIKAKQVEKRVIEVCKNIGLIDYSIENIRDTVLFQKNAQLSGGQMKRVSIAKAVCLNPDVLVADEPLTGLDASKRGKILQFFLDEWQKRIDTKNPLTMVIISHDIGMIAKQCDRIIVMYGDLIRKSGAIVEEFLGNGVLDFNRISQYHPYTQELINAANYFRENGQYNSTKRKLNGEFMNRGCVYNMYCPKVEKTRCTNHPRLETVLNTNNHLMACLKPVTDS